jgi:hypothetical protein
MVSGVDGFHAVVVGMSTRLVTPADWTCPSLCASFTSPPCAGNHGNSSLFYPAVYDNVVAVASVGPSLVKSGFSPLYEQIDLAAPGEVVLSTYPKVPPSTAEPSPVPTLSTMLRLQVQVPFRRTVTLANGTRTNITRLYSYTRPWLRLRLTDGPVRNVLRRPIVDCGSGLNGTCPGVRGRVCLIERGGGVHCRKVLNCKAGGGVAVLLYTDEAVAASSGTCQPFAGVLVGFCNPTDGPPLTSSDFLPTATLSRSDGLALRREIVNARNQGLVVAASVFASPQTSFVAQPSMAYLQVRQGAGVVCFASKGQSSGAQGGAAGDGCGTGATQPPITQRGHQAYMS